MTTSNGGSTMENLDNRVNFLAIDYSKTGNEESLKELLEMLKGMIAAKARTFAASTNTSADEFVALLTEAVWDSIRDGKIKDHDVTKSNVMQRIHTYWVRVHLHVALDERAHRRCANISAFGWTPPWAKIPPHPQSNGWPMPAWATSATW
jgi:hypothetical protein